MSWAAHYIGEPWVAGESDCWAFARRVWRERFGLEVPAVDVDALNRLASVRAFSAHPECAAWQQTAAPHDGCAVLMGKSSRPSHVGVWVDGGILHSVEGAGVIFTRETDLRLMGFRVLGFYRRAA